MKYIKYLFSALLFFPFIVSAQYISFTKENNGTNNISIPTGEIWQLASYSAYFLSGGEVKVYSSAYNPTNENNFIGRLTSTSGAIWSQDNAVANSAGAVFVGPTVIRIDPSVYTYYFVFKKLGANSTNSISATSIVIPTSASGDVDVKLEQSADNVTWTECLPGTYNSSTVKRFFRLRAVEK